MAIGSMSERDSDTNKKEVEVAARRHDARRLKISRPARNIDVCQSGEFAEETLDTIQLKRDELCKLRISEGMVLSMKTRGIGEGAEPLPAADPWSQNTLSIHA